MHIDCSEFKALQPSRPKRKPRNKKTTTKTNTKTKAMTKTFRDHLQRAIFETLDLWDIWSEWRGNMTWQTKINLENTLKWQSWRGSETDHWFIVLNSDPSRPNWWGLTNFTFGQIWVRAVSQFLRCFFITSMLSWAEDTNSILPDDENQNVRVCGWVL